MPACVLVCVCDTFSLSQPHQEPCHSLQSTYYRLANTCMGLTLGMAVERIFVLSKSTSHHDKTVDTALLYFPLHPSIQQQKPE